MPVTVLGESEASSRYYSFGTGSCSPTLRTLGPRSSQIQGPAGHSATCLDLLAPDCCAMWVRICTLAFGTVVSGVEDFASLLGGDRGLRGLLRVDSLLGGRVSCSLSRRFSSCLGVLKMSTAATEREIRDYLTTSVDSKPGIPAGLAEPIVEYLVWR